MNPYVSSLAKQRNYENYKDLQEEYMKLLKDTNQFEKVGEILESEGKYELALVMYLKSKKLIRIPSLIFQHTVLLEDSNMVSNVLKQLLKYELFEAAADIYERLDKSDLALECYKKGEKVE